MPASKSRKATRDRQLKAAEKADRLFEESQINDNAADDSDAGDAAAVDFSSAPKKTTAASDQTKPRPKPSTDSKLKPNPNRTKVKKRKAKGDGEAEDDEADDPKKVRFIVFVGKLPYSATTETIRAHFAKLEPKSIRHLTQKDTGRSKGCAFLEFERYDQMKECLKLYHNSLFDDGKGGEKRRINIELTVGGGGTKSRDRKEKLRAKNEKLADERKRRAEGRKDGGGRPTSKPKPQAGDVDQDRSGIHPSRLAKLQG